MSHLTIVEVEEQYLQLVAEGTYEEALTLITKEAHKFSDFSYHAEKVVYYWRLRMAALLKKADLVLQLLDEAVGKGHWFSGLAEDEEFELVHNSPEFVRLTGLCEERRRVAMETAVPILKTKQPPHDPPYPLLLALHGNNSVVDEFGEYWETAVSHGWFLGIPQSSQSYQTGKPSWVDWEWSLQEIRQHYDTLCTNYPINTQQQVLAGFSMGGGLATELALSGEIKVNGLLLIAPFLNDANSMVPYLEARCFPSDMKAYIVASEHDEYCCNIAQRLAELMTHHKITCHLEIYPDLGHSFPPPLQSKLPVVLSFLTQ
ncbi:MAG: hypothetical protein DWQ04_16750 [Chloroflexi bacterium]|nr:MAG: hypothetical protein DWQ04_16750 [Chloroflexota bacterium]